MRAQIAFLEAMADDAARSRHGDRLGMLGTGIAIENDIGDAVGRQILGQPGSVGHWRTQIPVQWPDIAPLRLIGGIEGDPTDGGPLPRHCRGEPPEERAMRALQEQERATDCFVHPSHFSVIEGSPVLIHDG